MFLGSPLNDNFSNPGTRRITTSASVDMMASRSSPFGSPQLSPRSNVPPPNPPFVFPARPSSSSASGTRASGRRPRSAIEPQISGLGLEVETERPKPRSPALPALPSFSFNPGASVPPEPITDNSFLSPTHSPTAPVSPRSIPVKPGNHGHRRGGSEFVGGNIRSGDSITVFSSSPTRSDSGMASPMLQPTKPRRGHAHRRSAAISSHDLSSIILPPSAHNMRGNSAPPSPALVDQPDSGKFLGESQPSPKLEVEPAESAPTEIVADMSKDPASEVAQESPKPAARNRVGFSDTLEYIPRPLSLVSSDTSSTITARPGHSGSGSISSVISITNVERDLGSPVGLDTPNLDDRPSTAGAVLERTESSQEVEQPLSSPRRRGSIPLLGPLPSPPPISPVDPSPTKSSKKWSLFGRDGAPAGSPTRTRPVSISSSESQSKSATPASISSERFADMPESSMKNEIADLKPLTKKRSKKQKKVKTWAGSILSRKSKQRYGKQKRRAPTPPPRRFADETTDDSVESLEEMSAEPEATMPTVMVTESSEEPWHQEYRQASLPDEDPSYQMIDLDAALGPFNTPLPRNPEWEAAQKAGGLVKKQLHSAAGMTRFSGPGMHYSHRRAESAPEMVPFEGGRFGFPRFGSSSTMADVFEEDEEEEDGSTGKTTGLSTPIVETPILEKPEEVIHEEIESKLKEDQGSMSADDTTTILDGRNENGVTGNSTPLIIYKRRPNNSSTSLREGVTNLESIDHNSTGTYGEASPRTSSSNSATPSTGHAFKPKDLAPVEVSPFNLPASSVPISPYSTTQSSAFPSPRSPISYDAHRISTAPSSVTDDNFQSLLMGEPGPEVRISVDDIPSLTSSNSTMTRESNFAQNPQARHPPLGEQQRPASFSSSAFGRRRSSLVSLSRLISSSHGERSKLSMEVSLDSEPEKREKISKTKRLGRIVQFWKSKETTST